MKKFACMLVATLLFGFGCGGNGGGENPARKPVANAGTSRTVPVNVPAQLDGSGSASPNGGLLTYQWTLHSRPGGSASALNNATVANPTFTPDLPGPYVLRLVVNDGVSASAVSEVTITAVVGNIVPVADAGPDQTVVLGILLVTLDGSGSHDANGDPITYAWRTISRPAGSAATLQHPNDVHPDFTPDAAGNYLFGLVVTDNSAASSVEDNVTVVVKAGGNVPPVADAGPNQSVMTGVTVTLDGSGSHDPNPADSLQFAWQMLSRPPASAATLSVVDPQRPTFPADVSGSYVFALVVTDNGSVASDPSTVTVSADRLASISVTPLDCVATLGFSVQYSAFGTYDIAGQKALTDNVTWSSDNTSIATIDATGFAVTWSEGVTVIRMQYGGLSFSTTLRVGPVTLQTLEITNPSPVQMRIGDKIELQLVGHYSDGTSLDLTEAATWSASFGGVSVISVNDSYQKGLVTAVGTGDGEVLATYGGKHVGVTVHVTQ